MSWFEVNRQGLAKIIEKRGKGPLIAELVQNAWDQNVTTVSIHLKPGPKRNQVEIIVEDDDPKGFSDISHAYTLFAESEKKSDPTKRGRFNLGEKLVIALCESATIETTTGTIVFEGPDRINKPRKKREAGSKFTGIMKMTPEEQEEVIKYLKTLIPPNNITTTLNGDILELRKPVHVFKEKLETEISDGTGILRKTIRKAEIKLFEPLPGEEPFLYEMGLPIVQTDMDWHVDIGQKIPLTLDRENVRSGYQRKLETFVLNAMNEEIDQESVNKSWVRSAMGNKDCSNQAVSRIMDLKYGDKRVSFDPKDPESSKRAVSEGYKVVHGAQMSKEEWENVRRAGAIEASSKLFPTPKPDSIDQDATLEEVIPKKDWTKGMGMIVNYANALAVALLGRDISIRIVRRKGCHFDAWYRPGALTFNLFSLGKKWFEQGITEDVDSLIVHEFGHESKGDHLSSDYHEALCLLAAKFKKLALDKPEFFKAFDHSPSVTKYVLLKNIGVAELEEQIKAVLESNIKESSKAGLHSLLGAVLDQAA